ncbi:hypothetical protein NECAME_17374 [Necator americanus]|uniref:Uncharacterized protein n=1 Tax=Necator americanus TaxID=51031 RepID=W2TPT6_NECAM|nr:hypothetical protein NECAME_17374 [Necator americanus]ETN83694.1 hypothetical protein NECAME_17374 [Necator americanus]
MRQIDDLRATVASLHASLCVDEYKVGREKRLMQQLERAESELRPLQELPCEFASLDAFVKDSREVEEVRSQLHRIRDPLFQHLPVSYLTKLENGDSTVDKYPAKKTVEGS